MSVRRDAIRAAVAIAITLGAAFATMAGPASAATKAPRVRLVRVATLSGTTAMAIRPGHTALYVTEQSGVVRVMRDGRLDPDPVLDISSETNASGEQGLLGLAFSPDGGHLYIDYTDKSGDTHVDEFAIDGDSVDTASRRELLFVEQPQPNHNGGQLAFGPDGYLYIALGDGGGGGDQGPGHAPGGNGQSLQTLLGKILRIDVHPSGTSPYTIPPDNPFVGRRDADPEIWSYGLRNPWRFSFDADTGDLWIGDVGQNAWEEVDFARARNGRDAGRGLNFGWNRREGMHEYSGPAPGDAVDPVYETSHDDGNCSITGGFVYRGADLESLHGMYVLIDYCKGDLVALARNGNSGVRARDLGVSLSSVSSFGEGPDKELYLLSQDRGIYKLGPSDRVRGRANRAS